MPVNYRQAVNPPPALPSPVVPAALAAQLGSGLALPPVITNNVFQLATGVQKVNQDILCCLATAVNRRMGQCDYGSELPYMTFGLLTQELAIEMQRTVNESLAQWVPQINLVNVSVSTYGTAAGAVLNDNNQALIIVQYYIKGTSALNTVKIVSGNDGVVFDPASFTVNGVPIVTRYN